MILPRLCINDSRYRVELYYPEEPDEAISVFSGSSKAMCEAFMNLLYMALENYDEGYCAAINDSE